MGYDAIVLKVAFARLEAQRNAVADGDGFALLAAIRICANYDLAMPTWLAEAYIPRFDRVLSCRAGSWDDVFGRPYPKNVNLSSMRKRRTLRFAVLNAVQNILMREPATAINRLLFDKIGEELHPPISGSAAEKLYYAAEKMFAPARRPKS